MKKTLLQTMLRPFGLIYFNQGGATGHVIVRRNGATTKSATGWAGWIRNGDAVAVIPTTPLVIPFEVRSVMTRDNQYVVVAGSVVVKIAIDTALEFFDYTMEPETGEYQGDPEQDVISPFINLGASTPVRKACGVNTAQALLTDYSAIHEALSAALKNDLKGNGLEFVSCSITGITAFDSKLAADLGAKEREAITTEADTARHTRQLASEQNAFELQKERDAAAMEAETRRQELIEARRANDLAEADIEAEVLAKKMQPLLDAGPQAALIVALNRMAEKGVNNLHVGPELMNLLTNATGR